MSKLKLICTLLFTCVYAYCFAEVIPADGSKLNYTNVYFEGEFQQDASEYRLVICSDPSFTQVVTEIKNTLPAFWVPALDWGHSYYWKIIAYSKTGSELEQATVHTFSIQKLGYNGASQILIDIKTNKKGQHSDGILAIDYTRSLYNRDGNAVWTLPAIGSSASESSQVRDLKVTKDNTLTFFNEQVPTEVDVYGATLWSAPFPFILNNDTVFYHHDFKKTKSGTYMVLGNKKVFRKVIGHYTPEDLKNFEVVKKDTNLYCKVLMTVLLEFNKEGKLVWFWDSNNYIKDEDLNFKKNNETKPPMATHSNAFSLNEAGTKIYISFRDLSRIVKLDKKTKTIELSYGEKYPSGEAKLGNSLFKRQSDVSVTNHGTFFVFNNNSHPAERWYSSVLEIKDNPGPKDSLQLWKFALNFDGLTSGKSFNGGNVCSLPNANLLVCTGSTGRIFEITKSKEIVWDAIVRSKQTGEDTTWKDMPQYRSSWTAGLKRYYVLITCKTLAPLTPGTCTLKLTLYNTGNADDSYQVEVFSEKKAQLYKTTVSSIKKDAFADKVLNFKNNKQANSFTVVVTSVHSGRKTSYRTELK